ncbi:MAG: hypothetical protein ACR2KA_04495 [Opitutales bacterium]|jgi:hypothetical protein
MTPSEPIRPAFTLFRLGLLGAGALLILPLTAAEKGSPQTSTKLYTQTGTDPSFKELVGENKAALTQGAKGSKIAVNLAVVEELPEARRPIAKDINLHTLPDSSIPRKDFPKWTRWYQEDGHTQIFRLFPDEVNLHSARPLAARVEAFSKTQWTEAQGNWHEWSGVVTPINPVGMSLQVKNSVNDWAMNITIRENGDVLLDHRRAEDVVIAHGMLRKSFLLRVRDNGLDYEVYLNGHKAGEGRYKRPEGKTCFRWGMYVGEHEVRREAMILFSGVTIDGHEAK